MLVQELAAIANNFEYAAQGCFEGERSSRSDFGLDFRPVFHLPQIEAEEKTQHTATERPEKSEEKTVFGAVATPLWTAFQPPNAFGAGGRYRPSCPADLLAPSPAEL